MLLFFLIILILFVIILLIIFSEIKLIIDNLEITNSNQKNIPEYKCKIGLYFLGKIKLFSIKINNKKTKKILEKDFVKDKIEKIKIKNVNANKYNRKMTKIIIKQIIKISKISKLNLKIYIDTTNVIFTSYLVGIISSIIPNILRNSITSFNSKDYKFNILPLYKNQNYIYVNLNCIISIKIVHIISILKMLVLKNNRNIKV